MSNTKRPALGKGLSALLQDSETDITSKTIREGSRSAGAVATLPADQIETNPFQPRTHFEQEGLDELTASIREHGIIQPITVRKVGYDQYQIISGERRFRSARLAGFSEIPAYIRIANDEAMLEMALVENIQREDLNAIEIALSYKRLIEECRLSQEQLSEKVSKQRSTIANYMRLLKLPPEIQLGIRDKKISMGHARALLAVEDPDVQINLYQQILKSELSVRSVEELAKGRKIPNDPNAVERRHRVPLSFEQQKIQEDLGNHFKTKVDIKRHTNGQGKIVIHFRNDKELEHVLGALKL